MKNQKIIIFLVTLQFSFFSCNKDNLPVTSPQGNTEQLADIEVQNGYLSFKNDSVFRNVAEQVLKSKQDELDNWEDEFPGFKSYRRVFNSIQSSFGDIQSSTELDSFKKLTVL